MGTPKGTVCARDVRVISEPDVRWNADFVLWCTMSFEPYIDPSEQLPEIIVKAPSAVVHDGLPEMPEAVVKSRRMRLGPQDLNTHRYTGGCPRCVHLRRGGAGPI